MYMRDNRRGRDDGGFQPRSFAPVKVGDELEVTIEAVGEKGDGVAKKDGFVLFVPCTKQGDKVKIRVTRVLRKVGFAEVVGEGSASGESQESAPQGEETQQEEYSSEEQSEPQSDSEDSENFGEEENQ